MAVIVYCDTSGTRAYLKDTKGGIGASGEEFSENQADAIIFANAGAATAYLAANPRITQVVSQLVVTGITHYGKKTANL